MNEINDPLSWVAKAEEDYATAKWAARRKKPLTYSACFHAQQCAEKYLKGILVARGSAFSKVHDLLKLSAECERVGVLLPINLTQLDKLSSYAIRVRYPGEEPTSEEAREALEIAQAVPRFARKFLGIK
jgi:HEPN domain-containing protein